MAKAEWFSSTSGIREATRARAVHETYKAKTQKLVYEQMQGKLVDSDAVLAAATSAFANCRIRLRSLGRSLAPLLANRGAAEIEKLLSESIDSALLALSTDCLAPASNATRATDDSEPHPLPN